MFSLLTLVANSSLLIDVMSDIVHDTRPDKHYSPKLSQTLVRAVLDILCDRWKHRRIIVGGDKKKCWWVAADRDPQFFGKQLQIYESEK